MIALLILVGIVLFIACLILLPLGLIWSLNTLFLLAIPYTFFNWLAALLLMFIVSACCKASISVKKGS